MARILLADDEPQVRRVLSDIVSGAGHEVEEAYDGLDALDKVKAFRPDLLLLDWMITEFYGGEVLEKIRHDPEYAEFKDLKVIVVSDFCDDKSLADFRKAGANDFVTKLDDPDALKKYLIPRINECLGVS